MLFRSLAVLGTNLYAGGFFTIATNNGGAAVTVNRIARWNGPSWSDLGSGMNAAALGAGPDVAALAVIGTNLYVGGAFTSAGGNSSIQYLARWNGSAWSALGAGVNYSVFALAASGPDLYAGGWFYSAGGIPANAIAKWNGSSWSTLGSGLTEGGGNFTRAIVSTLAMSGNDLFASGRFYVAGGKVSARVARARISFTPDQLALQANAPGAQTNTLTFAGVPNFPYFVQYATNVTDSPWFTLSTNAPNAQGIGTAIDSNATDPQRFYRVGYQE